MARGAWSAAANDGLQWQHTGLCNSNGLAKQLSKHTVCVAHRHKISSRKLRGSTVWILHRPTDFSVHWISKFKFVWTKQHHSRQIDRSGAFLHLRHSWHCQLLFYNLRTIWEMLKKHHCYGSISKLIFFGQNFSLFKMHSLVFLKTNQIIVWLSF